MNSPLAKPRGTVECPHCHQMVDQLYINEDRVRDPDDSTFPIGCLPCLKTAAIHRISRQEAKLAAAR
jgi:hypothetical protein